MDSEVIKIQQEKVKTFYSRHGRAKKTHFSLCGLAINQDGKVTESKMFDFLGLNPKNTDISCLLQKRPEKSTTGYREPSGAALLPRCRFIAVAQKYARSRTIVYS